MNSACGRRSWLRIALILFLAFSTKPLLGFSLLGPYADWQTQALGYRLPGDIGGPMKATEGYRWNVPVLTYGFDPTFVGYFGTNGVAAVEQAFAILNRLPHASLMSSNLEEFPLNTTAYHGWAAELNLMDLTSVTLHYLLEGLGLGDPERHTYLLRARELQIYGTTTYTNYLVLMRNFDPVYGIPTNSVNEVSYGYFIEDPLWPPFNYADAVEYAVLPFQPSFTSVAGFHLLCGLHYTGLTRDDVGGLRFLLLQHPKVESVLPGVQGCGPNPMNFVDRALRPGVGKITFLRMDLEIPGGQFKPMTNEYMDTFITNNTVVQQRLKRVITRPDFLFSARNLGFTNGNGSLVARPVGTSRWVNNATLPGNYGPGVIQPPADLVFNTGLPGISNYAWGSFNTQATAVVYPQRDPMWALVPLGAQWKYLDDGTNPGTNWMQPGYDDHSWLSGPTQLGHGGGDEATVTRACVTTYFRHAFTLEDPSGIQALALRLLCADGGMVYLNGTPLFSYNMPTGVTSSATLACRELDTVDGTNFVQVNLKADLLVPGTNLIAVEVHQASTSSTKTSFDLELAVSQWAEFGPRVLSCQSSPSTGEFQFTFSRILPGTTNILESSTNLLDWVAVATNVPSTTTWNVRGIPLAAAPQRFYRVKALR